MVTLYHTGCPKCKVIESKLKTKGISYDECTDISFMLKLGIISVPWLDVDGEMMDFARANKWINDKDV